MRIELEILEEHERSNTPAECCVCRQRYVVGAVMAFSYSFDGVGGEPVCPSCLEAGPEVMAEHLRKKALWSRRIADQDEELAEEEVEAPTLEDLRLMEAIAAL